MLTPHISQVLGWAGWAFFSISICFLAWRWSRKRWASFAKRLASRRFQNKGFGTWPAVWAVSIVCVVGMVYGASQWPVYSLTTEHDIAVIGVHGPYRFTWRHVDTEGELYGDEFTHDVCKDFASPEKDFPLGIILNKMVHTDEGDCWSLNPDKHSGYFKRRNPDKSPMFARGYK